jgi:hypothetical protein
MGHQSDFQPKLFHYYVNLEEKIPQDHILQKIRNHIDFDFVYNEVKKSLEFDYPRLQGGALRRIHG